MPLLTHDETGATSVAKAGAVGLRTPIRPGRGEPTRAATGPRRQQQGGPQRSGPQQKRAERRKGARPPRTTGQRIRRWLLIVLGLAVVCPFAAFAIGWMIFKVPTADDAAIVQTARFTFSNGDELATVRPQTTDAATGKKSNINREMVALDKIPLWVRQSVLAAEDRTFYSNPGFDITGIARAIWNQLGGGIGGGSTITQQYIKVSTGQDQASLLRKYKEIVLSVKISKDQTKDQILENYLNTIYFGRGAYGIQAASKAYFGKPVDQLSVPEGAMLAGIIQSPTNWDPAQNLNQSTRRWNFVMDQMAQAGWITSDVRANAVFPDTWLKTPPPGVGMPVDDRLHIYKRAVAELNAHGITPEQVDTLGLTVTTTVDPARQKAAVDAVNKTLKGQPDTLRAAVVSIDPKTGAIVAYYGGINGPGQDYAGGSELPPGSSFKPFVLAAALQANKGIGLGSTYDGSSPQIFKGVQVANSDGDNCDQCNIKTAMTKSINTIFYKIAIDVGPANVIDAAHKAGIPADLLTHVQAGIALGDQEVHPIDMAAAYGTFAADGVRHDPYIVSKVVAADGRVLLDRTTTDGQQAFSQQVARNVTESMLDVPDSSGFALADGRISAAKTGTVQLGDTGSNRDAWTVGYTPSLSTAVWVGTDAGTALKTTPGRNVFGRTLPGPIWQQYMNTALRGTPKEQFSTFVAMGTPIVDYSTDSASPTDTAQSSDGNNSGGGNNGNGNGNGGGNDTGGTPNTGFLQRSPTGFILPPRATAARGAAATSSGTP